MSVRGGVLTLSAASGSGQAPKSVPEIPNVESFVRICVSDTGEGIRSEDLPYIFEPLFTTKKTGNGIGLSVAYQIVTAHAGHIFVESKRGEGTTFHMLLPRITDGLETADDLPDATSAFSKHRVLLVEDDATIATGLRWILESEGMTVSVVGLASAVIAAVDEFQPDIVVLDLSLPDGDGRSLYEPIVTRGLPVIFSTGSAGVDDLIESGDSVSVLKKPYSADDLLRAIYERLSPAGSIGS
jgi:CheY-like chemotaxis protein